MAAMARQKARTCSRCCSLLSQSIRISVPLLEATLFTLDALAFLLHQPLTECAAATHEEHRDAMQHQAQAPPEERVDRPRTAAEAVVRDREDEEVDQHEDGGVDIPTE